MVALVQEHLEYEPVAVRPAVERIAIGEYLRRPVSEFPQAVYADGEGRVYRSIHAFNGASRRTTGISGELTCYSIPPRPLPAAKLRLPDREHPEEDEGEASHPPQYPEASFVGQHSRQFCRTVLLSPVPLRQEMADRWGICFEQSGHGCVTGGQNAVPS